MALLNTSSSIVDYLKSAGQDSSYTSRTKLYGSSGLESKYGGYVGSGQQNTALLNYIRSQSQLQQPQQSQPVSYSQLTNQGGTIYNTQTNQGYQTPEQLASAMGYQNASQIDWSQIAQQQPNAQQVVSNAYTQTGGQAPVTPTQTQTQQAPQLSTYAPKSYSEILAGITGTAEYKLTEEETKAAKEEEARQLAEKKAGIQSSYENRMIPSSGMKMKEFEEADIESAADQLQIDRGLAKIVLQAIQEGQNEEAQKLEESQRLNASILEAAGYVDVGGKLYPTLAREKYESDLVADSNKVAEPEIRQVGSNIIQINPNGSTQVLYQSPDSPEIRTLGDQIVEKQQDGTWKVVFTGTSSGTNTTKTYETELRNEIDKLYAGTYGTAGAREKVIANLQSKFPGIDVAKDIYKRVPDGYESNISKKATSDDLFNSF